MKDVHLYVLPKTFFNVNSSKVLGLDDMYLRGINYYQEKEDDEGYDYEISERNKISKFNYSKLVGQKNIKLGTSK